MRNLVKTLSSVFYLGYSPIAPGTNGALVGVAAYLLLKDNLIAYSAVLAFCIFFGFFLCNKAEEIFGEKDSKKIVFDEAVGALITFYMVFYNEPAKIVYIIIGFLLYRGFDIVKPFPIRRLENLKGGWGIMMDDIVAGVYSNICLSLIILFFD